MLCKKLSKAVILYAWSLLLWYFETRYKIKVSVDGSFCTRLISKIGSKNFTILWFDSTYQSAEEKLANLHYRIVKLGGPSVYATRFKGIWDFLPPSQQSLCVRTFCIATQIMTKVGFVNYFMSGQSQRIHRGVIVVIIADYLFMAMSTSFASFTLCSIPAAVNYIAN